MNSTPSLAASSVSSVVPNASKFHSPLKKRQLHELIPHNQEELKKQHLDRPPKRRRLQPVPLFASSTIEGLDVPDKLKPTVQAIEAYTHNLGHLVTAEVQAKMAAIIESQGLSLEEKEIELGLLYFYVTAHKNLPQKFPLFIARLEEIEGEVLLLQEEQKQACPNKEISSGALHYIQRAFFHMIFSEDGAFNTGGCLAVQKFLTQSRLNLLLTEEERNRILSTVTLLLEDKEFKDLFMQPLTPHPTLKRVLSLDMKKSSKESLSTLEIRWALLLQFFSIIGQKDEGNCYAVASYLNLLNEHPKVLLNMTIELLKSGKLEFEGVEIPVYLIMGNRLQWEEDFIHECDPDTVYTLTPVVVAQNALGIRKVSHPDNSNDFSLNTLLPHAFGTSTEEAKQLITAHKFNMVQQMMLSVLQFIAKNASTHTSGDLTMKAEMFQQLREMYLPFLLKQLKRTGLDHDEEIDNFFDCLDAQICKTMYLVDMRNWTYVVRENRITFDNHSVGLVIQEKDLEDDFFKFMTRLYVHKEGNFLPVERISEFSTYMAGCVEEALGTAPSLKVEKTAALLKSFLPSFAFQLHTAQWLEKQNKLCDNNLDADIYLKSDSFFLSPKGSWSCVITDFGPLQATYSPRLTFSSSDIKDFFKNLCSQVRDIVKVDPFYQKGGDHKILMSFPGHCCNLTPNMFSRYWATDADVLEERVTQPARDLLARTISEKQKKLILFYFGDSTAQTSYAGTLSRPMSAKEFKEEMLAQITEEMHDQFKEAFNKGLQEIAYGDLKSQATNLLEKLVRPLSTEEKAQVVKYLKKHKKYSYLSPYQTAKLLRKASLIIRNSIDIPTDKWEQAVRELFGLPDVVTIANLNWVEEQSEHLKYVTLVIHQDLANEKVILSIRKQDRQAIFKYTGSLIEKTSLLPHRPPTHQSHFCSIQ